MKKVYRALCEGSCEKRFIGNEAAVPEGWFESPAEAHAASSGVEPAKRGPGRPRKAED